MSDADFVTRLIAHLRAADLGAVPLFGENARRLADNLEWRIAHPQGDAYDIRPTGDDEADPDGRGASRISVGTMPLGRRLVGPSVPLAWRPPYTPRIMVIFGKEQPEEVTVHGRPLSCVICQNGTFYQRRAQLHGPVATLFNLEWTAPTATCVICSACGYVHWFLQS